MCSVPLAPRQMLLAVLRPSGYALPLVGTLPTRKVHIIESHCFDATLREFVVELICHGCRRYTLERRFHLF